MGFFSKLFNKLHKKESTKVAEQIEQINAQNRIFKDNSNSKFDEGLRKSSNNLNLAITELMKNHTNIDSSLYESLEDMLVMYDVGYSAALKIVDAVRDEVNYQNINKKELIKEILLDKMLTYYIQDTNLNTNINFNENKTNTILIIGANGVGKTTSIAKIANYFVKNHKKVLLVAGDTFRAGAIEQLKAWAEKLNVDIVIPKHDKQETASVIYEGLQKGYSEKYDVIICDTSGRLQNKINLMNELKKIYDIIHKFDESAPHESLLVLDATTGQSGLSQAKMFNEVAKLSGIILSKMDSTSKGGIVLAIKDMFNIPVKFIGLGEGLDDLRIFDLEKFIHGLLHSFNDLV